MVWVILSDLATFTGFFLNGVVKDGYSAFKEIPNAIQNEIPIIRKEVLISSSSFFIEEEIARIKNLLTFFIETLNQ